MLGKGSKFTVEDFERLQHDEASLPARELVPLLRGRLADFPVSTQRAAELLLRWDRVLAKESAGAAIYEMWIQRLSSTFRDRILPSEARSLVASGSLFTTMIRALKNPDAKLFGANAQGKARVLISMSFADAVTELRARFGPDMKKWRWGDLHLAEFKHPLSSDDATRFLFDLRTVARGGDGNTVNATGGAKFIQRTGASFREIFDLSDWDNSVAINVPGQSGQPASRHYGDLLPLWAEGKYFPLLFSRDKVEKNAAERLLLEPSGWRTREKAVIGG